VTHLLIPILVIEVLLLGLVSFIQLLYLESLRLRARDLPALEYFKNVLEDRIGLKTEDGAFAYSLVKHALLVVLGLTATVATLRDEAADMRGIAEAAGVGMSLMLLSAYVGPQLLYRRTSAKWLTPFAPLLRLVGLVTRPFTSFVSILEALSSLNKDHNGEKENGKSQEDDLEALIEAGADEGLIEEDDRQLIHSVVTLGDKTVRQVMTPRPNVMSIQAGATIEDFRKVAIENHFSRFPVYRESIDEIIGFVHVRDILKLDYSKRVKHTVEEFIHPTQFVPETKPVADLFREMQRNNTHLAIVVDEYGETAGIATMEDVVEEVFGEIEDEYDPKADIKEESAGVFLANGDVDLDLLYELVEFRPDEETESTTIGGLVSEWLGCVPEVGEVAEQDGIRIEVTAADERHVTAVRVSRSATADTEDEESE
jgi:magnesium and cobalt exporter, CNNM family